LKNLGIFFLQKGIRMVTLLVAICFISFLLIKNSPIDPVQAYIGGGMLQVSLEQRGQIAAYWGLDQPVGMQFLNWGSVLVHGDLFSSSLSFIQSNWNLACVIVFVLGIDAAMKKGALLYRFIKAFCYTLA